MITLLKDPFFQAFDKMFEFDKEINVPKTKVQKNESGYILSIPTPGLTKSDLKITTKDGILKIVFEKEGGSSFVPNFSKSYTLPEDVNENQIEGKVENGVLELTLPISKKKSLEKLISLN